MNKFNYWAEKARIQMEIRNLPHRKFRVIVWDTTREGYHHINRIIEMFRIDKDSWFMPAILDSGKFSKTFRKELFKILDTVATMERPRISVEGVDDER